MPEPSTHSPSSTNTATSASPSSPSTTQDRGELSTFSGSLDYEALEAARQVLRARLRGGDPIAPKLSRQPFVHWRDTWGAP
jgi:hypothetical protein